MLTAVRRQGLKPQNPVWNRAEAARLLPGVQGAWYFNEGVGPTCYDLSGRMNHATLQGTAVQIAGMRQSGQYGRQLLIPSSLYGSADSVAFGIRFPMWSAMLGMQPYGSGQGYSLFQGSTAGSQYSAFLWNISTQQQISWVAWDGTNVAVATSATGTVPLNVPIVVIGISYTANDHRVYLNDRQVASSTTAVNNATCNVFTFNQVRRATAAGSAFLGPIIAAATGCRSIPDPAALASNWLSGRFAEIRPRRRNVVAMRSGSVIFRRGLYLRSGSRTGTFP